MAATIALPFSALRSSSKSLILLSRLLFPRQSQQGVGASAPNSGVLEIPISELTVTQLTREQFDDLAALADTNHVLVRAFDVALNILREANDEVRAEWFVTALAKERARVANAKNYLLDICHAFEAEGFDVTVIKSLDHWPDLGSDIDLYTNAQPAKVIRMMAARFKGTMAERSWGDRLACKWNFEIPGLPEAVEVHMGRLGQTGEQITLASRLAGRSREVQVEGETFSVPAVSDRLLISTLQRMYRHFYFRLCDVVDSAGLVDNGLINYEDLRAAATASGIWEGTATYLVIVSDYVKRYRGTALDLPRFVRDAARFGDEEVYFRKDFLRVPILPQSAKLYGIQLSELLRKRELHSSARLGLLPWLATAAAVGQKLTGSDKGIW